MFQLYDLKINENGNFSGPRKNPFFIGPGEVPFLPIEYWKGRNAGSFTHFLRVLSVSVVKIYDCLFFLVFLICFVVFVFSFFRALVRPKPCAKADS